jgi:patatin-like phospholipase/acyl hydrolase
MDGGGIRGMIGCKIIEQIENESYKYAKSKGYTVPKQNDFDKKLHVNQLFDMLAGTSTGSIMTGLLSIPKKKNNTKEAKYYINETIRLYRKNGT